MARGLIELLNTGDILISRVAGIGGISRRRRRSGRLSQFLHHIVGNLFANFVTNRFHFGFRQVSGAHLLHHTVNGADDARIRNGLADAHTVRPVQVHQHPRVEGQNWRPHKLITSAF